MDGCALSVNLEAGPQQHQEVPADSGDQRHGSEGSYSLAGSVVDGAACCHLCHTSCNHALKNEWGGAQHLDSHCRQDWIQKSFD